MGTGTLGEELVAAAMRAARRGGAVRDPLWLHCAHHDSRGPISAVTFAADERRPAFQHCIEQNRSVLQLMAMYFHAHARRRLSITGVIDGVALSPRELECLEWAALGKSAWEIGRLLNISRRTAAFHLDNAKMKFSVSTICQAVAKLATSKATTE